MQENVLLTFKWGDGGLEVQYVDVQYKSKETPQLIGLFSPNLVITNFMQCFLYGPIG